MASHVAIGLVVLIGSAPVLVARQSFVCSPIYAGETLPAVALRLTGKSDNLYQPWFRIVDASGRFVPQSQYRNPGRNWRGCLQADIPQLPSQPLPGIGRPNGRIYDGRFAVRIGGAAFLILLPWLLLAEYVRRVRPVPAPLRSHANCFVSAFARPLLGRSSTLPPIQSRLRYLPAREEVEILIAPGSGRRYPNLTDHRVNVEYDVRRVLRLLGDRLVVTRPLRIEGQWVVVSLRSNAEVKEAGVT
jgi:hypothetical protein